MGAPEVLLTPPHFPIKTTSSQIPLLAQGQSFWKIFILLAPVLVPIKSHQPLPPPPPKKLTIPKVVKSSRLPVKIAAYLVSIGRLLCLTFLYRWRFLNKISLDWLLTLATQPSTSNPSDNPASLTTYNNKRKFTRSL